MFHETTVTAKLVSSVRLSAQHITMDFIPTTTATQWTFVGEGGKNALFAYRANSCHSPSSSCYQASGCDYLLRLRKEDLAISRRCCDVSVQPFMDATQVQSSHTNDTSDEASLVFAGMICDVLNPYGDLPELVALDWPFVAALYHIALQSNQIQPGRYQDWDELHHKQQRIPKTVPMGLLLWNYRQMTSIPWNTINHSHPVFGRVVSLEIKPKAGYRAFSPFVAPTRNRAKFTHSRFVLQQHLYIQQRITRGWMNQQQSLSMHSRSLYDPLDLFSGDVVRIRRALHCLMVCSQNNLTVTLENEVLIGNAGALTNEKTTSDRLWADFRRALLLNSNDIDCQSHIVDMVVAVLSQEDFLPRLLALQKIDILDADGAIEVYKRLVALCDDSFTVAEELVDRPLKFNTTHVSAAPHPLLEVSPLIPPEQYENCVRLCDQVQEMVLLLEKYPDDTLRLITDPETEKLRKLSLATVATLSKEECQYLLQTWLLSLTFCDISFFITFQTSPYNEKIDRMKQNNKDVCHSSYQVRSRQSKNSSGRLIRRCNGDLKAFWYQLKVIDFDRKPAIKLRKRHEKEMHFDNIAAID